jgi:hypothetical protein
MAPPKTKHQLQLPDFGLDNFSDDSEFDEWNEAFIAELAKEEEFVGNPEHRAWSPLMRCRTGVSWIKSSRRPRRHLMAAHIGRWLPPHGSRTTEVARAQRSEPGKEVTPKEAWVTQNE